MTRARPRPLLRLLYRAPAWIYRWRCGWLLGHRFLLLDHVGRRTGRHRQTVLEIIEYRADGPEAVIVSAYGQGADWLRNIEAGGGAAVTIGTRQFAAIHRRLGPDEASAALAGYQRRNRLIGPLVRRGLSHFLGWRYDGSAAHRRRLAVQLPVIAFRPRP